MRLIREAGYTLYSFNNLISSQHAKLKNTNPMNLGTTRSLLCASLRDNINRRQCVRIKCQKSVSSIYPATLEQEIDRQEIDAEHERSPCP